MLQNQLNGYRLRIGYWTRSLTDTKRNYTTTDKECLAVLWKILALRLYLSVATLNLGKDHEAARWVLNLVDSSSWFAGWRLRLAEYDYGVQLRPGVKKQMADSFLCLRTEDGNTEAVDDEVSCFVFQV